MLSQPAATKVPFPWKFYGRCCNLQLSSLPEQEPIDVPGVANEHIGQEDAKGLS
jgi:hypothetical protein